MRGQVCQHCAKGVDVLVEVMDGGRPVRVCLGCLADRRLGLW